MSGEEGGALPPRSAGGELLQTVSQDVSVFSVMYKM